MGRINCHTGLRGSIGQALNQLGINIIDERFVESNNGGYEYKIDTEPLIDAFVRQEIKNYCEAKGLKLDDNQMSQAVKGVSYWLSGAILDSIDTAVDMVVNTGGD